MGRFSKCIVLLLVSFASHAWEIDNQTAFPLTVTRSIYTAASVNPLSTGACSYLVPPICVDLSEPETQRNEQVTLSIATGIHNCEVTVPGDGKVEVLFQDRNVFKQSAGSQNIPSVFSCVASAEFSTGFCPYDPPGVDYDAKCVVDTGTGTVEVTDRHPYSDPSGKRNVRFLGTGDPQYNQHGAPTTEYLNSDNTLLFMNLDLDLDSELRGAIISGDLTQGAYWDEFAQYLLKTESNSNFFYEGLGNHDVNCAAGYDCGGAGGFAGDGGGILNPNRASQIKDYVFDHTYSTAFQGFPTYGYGDRTMLDRWTPMTYGLKPHYSWDWHDVHFVNLNVFPGDFVDAANIEATRYIDPMFSLTFLQTDLLLNASPDDGTIGKPVVIIMHYPPSNEMAGAFCINVAPKDDFCDTPLSYEKHISDAQQVAFWNVIRNYNVVAILYGHVHLDATWANTQWARNWTMPSGATARPAHLPASIQTFNLAAARGGETFGQGVYFDVTMDCRNTMTLTQNNNLGSATGRTASTSFCSSFPASSCPGETGYADCDADLDGINDSIEVSHGCLDAANQNSDGDSIEDGAEDLNQNGVVDAGETNPCLDDTDDDGYNDDVDNCPSISNADQVDVDNDDIGDACDANIDSDGDGIDDASDNCPNSGPVLDDQTDTDDDGQGDVCDPDDDNDGIDDGPDTSDLSPTACLDQDGDTCDDCSIGVDGIGPLPDYDTTSDGPDLDGDGLCDAGDGDVDGDEIPNASDPDDDNDGLMDTDEASASTDSYNPDSDGDGIVDGLDRSPDDELNVASGCGGANAVLGLSVFDMVTCPGTETSETADDIEVDGEDDVDGPGNLLMIAPVVKFAPGFFVEPNASLGVVSSRPDALAAPVCMTYTSADVPILISESGTPTVTSTLSVSNSAAIVDLNVSSLSVTHTWINDLDIQLTSPSATTVQIMAQSCGSQDDLSLVLNDEAASGPWPCPPIGGSYQPSSPLAAFDGEDGSGIWTLTVNDNANQDGGSLDGWGLKLCSNP